MVAMLWTQQIMLGKAEYAKVPPLLKERVKELLIDSGYGIYLGSESSDTERYVMRFSHDAGRRVACELWHSGQQGRWVDGCYELSIPASSSVEIISKLLSFGPDGWPVAPERFVGDYWDAVRRMAERHPL